MSDGKTMDIETATRTVLAKNPAIKSKNLLEKVRGKTGKERSAIFDTWESMEHRHKLYREKGCYWLHKPEPQKTSFIKDLADWSERRAKRKEQSKARKKRSKEQEESRKRREEKRQLKELEAENDKLLASIIADDDEEGDGKKEETQFPSEAFKKAYKTNTGRTVEEELYDALLKTEG